MGFLTDLVKLVTGDDGNPFSPGSNLRDPLNIGGGETLGGAIDQDDLEELRRKYDDAPPADRRETIERVARDAQLTEDEAREILERMSVDYSQFIGIAFDVAKEKGEDFSTTQAEIRSGAAPSSEAMSVFADIWNDRKDEISSAAEARRVLEEEIQV